MRKLNSPFVAGGWGPASPARSPTGRPSSPSALTRPGSPSPARSAEFPSGDEDIEIVSPQALAVVLLQRLADDRENRYNACVDTIRRCNQDQFDHLQRAIAESDSAMDNLITRIVNLSLERGRPSPMRSGGGGGSSAGDSSPKTPDSSRRSKWGAVRGNLVGVSSQANPITGTPKKGFASIVTTLVKQKRQDEEEEYQAHEVAFGQRGNGMGDFVYVVNNLEDRIVAKAVEQHVEDYAAIHGEYSFQMEQLARRCFEDREVQFYQTTTVFSLESLQSELDHRELVTKVLSEQESSLRTKYEEEIQHLEDSIADLQQSLSTLKKEKADLIYAIKKRDKEIQTLHAVATERSAIMDVKQDVRREVRVLHYELNSDSFGESWQESLLKLRERILSELQNDNLRFIARVNTLLKRQLGDDEQLEQLYEARLRSALSELEEDNKQRSQAAERRHQQEMQHRDDMWRKKLEEQRISHESEKDDLIKVYRDEYDRKVNELNALFEERHRRLNAQRDEHEAFFAQKITEMREQSRVKDNDVEARAARRFSELNAHFEALSDELRTRFSEREKALEREKLQVQANFEQKVNEKVMQIRAEADELGQQLQDRVLLFLTQQRQAFESYREKEMHNFSQFAQISDKITSRKYAEGRRDQLRLHEKAIKDQRNIHDEEFQVFKEQTEHIIATKEDAFADRIREAKDNTDEMLRITQELRIEQDEKFWNECHNELIAANRLLIGEKTRLETLLQQRYSSLIDRCDSYLQNDIAAARAAFDAEQRQRISFFQNYCIYYHEIQLELEHELWCEQSERQAIHKEQISQMNNIRAMMSEEKRTVEFCEMLDKNPFMPIGVITEEELRVIREEYEQRILDKNRYVANITKDSLATIESHLRNAHAQHLRMEDVFAKRLDELVSSLQDKFKAYYSARTFVIEHEIKRIAEFAEGVVTNSIKGTNAIVKGASNVIVVGGQNQGGGTDGGAHWSEEVRVMEYFVSMKAILTQAMREFDEKLTERFKEAERQRRETFRNMHLEYVSASGALMKQMEQLKLANDFAEVSLQQAKTKLALQNTEYSKAQMLCDDMVDLLGHRATSRFLTNSKAQLQAQKTDAAGGTVTVPLRTLSDLAALRERIYCDEYAAYARGQLLASEDAKTPSAQLTMRSGNNQTSSTKS